METGLVPFSDKSLYGFQEAKEKTEWENSFKLSGRGKLKRPGQFVKSF